MGGPLDAEALSGVQVLGRGSGMIIAMAQGPRQSLSAPREPLCSTF